MDRGLRLCLALTLFLVCPAVAAAERPADPAPAAPTAAEQAPADGAPADPTPGALADPAAGPADPAPADPGVAPSPAAAATRARGVRTQPDEGLIGFLSLTAGLAYPRVGGLYSGDKAIGPSLPVRPSGTASVMMSGSVWILDRAPVNLGLQIGPVGAVFSKLDSPFTAGPTGSGQLNALVLPAVSLLVGVPLRYVRLYAGIGPAWGIALLKPDSDTPAQQAFYYGYRVVAGVELYIVNKFGITMEYGLNRVTKNLTFSDGKDPATKTTLAGVDYGSLTFGIVFSTPSGKSKARARAARRTRGGDGGGVQ